MIPGLASPSNTQANLLVVLEFRIAGAEQPTQRVTIAGGSPSAWHDPPRGSLRKFASQRSALRGLCGGLFEGSALAGILRGCHEIFEGFPMAPNGTRE